MTRILMINSGKAEALDELRLVAPGAHVDVLTEPAYRAQYPGDAHLTFVDDIGDLTAVRQAALRMLADHPIDHVVAPSERSVPAGGYLRSYLGLPGIGFEVANRFTNKAVMKAALTRAGLPVAAYRVAAGLPAAVRAAHELGGPVVLKPAFGTGSMNVHGFTGAAELADFAASAAGDTLRRAACPLLVERMVEMSAEYHSDAIVRDGRLVFASVGRYLVSQLDPVGRLNGSYLLPGQRPESDAVRRLHESVVTALGLRDGVTHLEVYQAGTELVVGEISCRPAGGGITDMIKAAYGVDLWEAFNRVSLGLPAPTVPARPARDGLVAVCLLPVRPGRVKAVTGAEELSGLDGVISASVRVRPGSVIGARLHSASAAGTVLIEATDADLLHKRIDLVAERFRLDLEPLG
ncbi:ATP-grasp domain-containing protein [Actinoplanes flavus]|uniref:ATP-grasp domain-containing protein n=1 Tax=Actinoplanes flavus TaxID=2820290 RepID=A0ABS3UN69_9ACTN|nr:hypothetical protein [Actinoplanes flavus]MBO3740235.1 hypothetical protein [Actinoplanes flavus]